MIKVNFEVFGLVQGVFFRKYTAKEAKKLGLRGWCKNTLNGTVEGQIEGEKLKVEEMKRWLKECGSPQSEIDKTEFSNEMEINEFSFESFEVIR